MIANISSGSSFYSVAIYNQKKVDRGDGSILYSQKLRGTSPKIINRAFEIYNLSISQKAALHISLSFAEADSPQLDDLKLIELSKIYLEKMGYAEQPYIIYKHTDTKHPHVHVLTSRVDLVSQKRIEDSFERVRSKNITDKLEKLYGLIRSDGRQVTKMAIAKDVKQALQKNGPTDLKQLNQSLEQANVLTRVEQTAKGIIYYRVGEDGQRNSRPFTASYFKDVQLDALNLQARFENNTQERTYIQTQIKEALPKQGVTAIELFSKQLQEKGINTEFKVNSDNSIEIRYHYKNQVFEDSSLGTTTQHQLVFPEPQDILLRDQLTKSIAANEPLALDYQNSQLQIKTPNPQLANELNKRTDREKLAIADSYRQYQEQYQKAANPDIRKAVLALAATDIDDTLQDKINAERLDQRKMRR